MSPSGPGRRAPAAGRRGSAREECDQATGRVGRQPATAAQVPEHRREHRVGQQLGPRHRPSDRHDDARSVPSAALRALTSAAPS